MGLQRARGPLPTDQLPLHSAAAVCLPRKRDGKNLTAVQQNRLLARKHHLHLSTTTVRAPSRPIHLFQAHLQHRQVCQTSERFVADFYLAGHRTFLPIVLCRQGHVLLPEDPLRLQRRRCRC